MKDQNNPDIGKSYVQEFLEGSKDNEGNYLIVANEDFMNSKNTIWFQGFCQELELLLKMQKVVGEYAKYLENKNKK